MSYNKPKYDPEEVKAQALEAIVEHRLIFFTEISAYVPCSRATLYVFGLDKLDEIKEALEHNKIRVKASMRRKWYKSDNATLQLAAYRLASTAEEHRKLNQGYLDHTTQGQAMATLDLSSMPDEAIDELYDQLKNDDPDAAGK